MKHILLAPDSGLDCGQTTVKGPFKLIFHQRPACLYGGSKHTWFIFQHCKQRQLDGQNKTVNNKRYPYPQLRESVVKPLLTTIVVVGVSHFPIRPSRMALIVLWETTREAQTSRAWWVDVFDGCRWPWILPIIESGLSCRPWSISWAAPRSSQRARPGNTHVENLFRIPARSPQTKCSLANWARRTRSGHSNGVFIEISIILAGSESWVLFANKEEWRCHRGLWQLYIAFFQIFFKEFIQFSLFLWGSDYMSWRTWV